MAAAVFTSECPMLLMTAINDRLAELGERILRVETRLARLARR